MVYFDPVTVDIENEIWKRYGKTTEMATKDVESLKSWLQSQSHLPHTLTDNQIKNFLVMNQGNVEKCKPKIDMYYTMRTMFSEVFSDSNPFGPRMLEVTKYGNYITLPKYCPDLSKIILVKPKVDNDPLDVYASYCYLMNIAEIRLLQDFSDGNSVIFDAEHCKLKDLMKLTPTFFKIVQFIAYRVTSTKVPAIHVINAPKYVDHTLSLLKTILKPKLMDRIVVHPDTKSILKVISKDILPKDYGGNEKSLDELQELIFKEFEEYRDFFNQRDQLTVNEDLRPSPNVNDDFFGYYGTFKKIEVD